MYPNLSVAGPALLDRILDEARSILATVGIEVRGPALYRRMLAAGLKSTADGRILFPADVVDRALALVPAAFTLYDRAGLPHATVGGHHVHFVPGSSGLKIQDHRSGVTRGATTADFVDYVRLCDGLEHIRYLDGFHIWLALLLNGIPIETPPSTEAVQIWLPIVLKASDPVSSAIDIDFLLPPLRFSQQVVAELIAGQYYTLRLLAGVYSFLNRLL